MNTRKPGMQGTTGELARPRRGAPPPLPAAAGTRRAAPPLPVAKAMPARAPQPIGAPGHAPARVRPSPIVVSRDPLEETIVKPLRLEEMQAQLAHRAALEAQRQRAYEAERFAAKAALAAPPAIEPEPSGEHAPLAKLEPVAKPEPVKSGPSRVDSTTQPSVRRRALRRGGLSRETFQLVVKKLGEDYRALSTPKRLLIPIAVMILALAAPTSSRAGENAPRAPAVTARATTTTGAPSAATTPGTGIVTVAVASAALPAALAGTSVTSAAAAADPLAETKVLPSARALAPAAHAKLSADEQRLYDRAIHATLAGEYEAASLAYTKLVMAHPDSAELRAAVRVLAAKQKRKAQR